jgi:glycogen debranching enzyme
LQVIGTPAADFSAAYQLAFRVLEFNLREGLLEAGEGYGTWTRDTAINSWNAISLVLPDVALSSLLHETEPVTDGVVVSGQYWDKVIWIVAAHHHVLVTGDLQFARNAYGIALRTLEQMRKRQFDPQTGLYRGPAVYGDGVAAYPDPPFDDQRGDNIRDYYEGSQLEVSSTNGVYYGAYRAAAALGRIINAPAAEIDSLDHEAESLHNSIRGVLWMPDVHRFAYFRDPNGHLDKTQEGLGEAFAILFGIADKSQAHEILEHAYETPWGIACTWPPYSRYQDASNASFGRHNGTIWPFINAFWATAAVDADVPRAFAKEFQLMTTLALNAGDFSEIYHPYTGKPYGGVQTAKEWNSVRHQTWSASGYLRMVYSGLFGLRFTENGIRLQPNIPVGLGIQELRLKELPYRKATLSITVRGTGNRIQHFWIDGKAQGAPVIPSTLDGLHEIVLELGNADVQATGRKRK